MNINVKILKGEYIVILPVIRENGRVIGPFKTLEEIKDRFPYLTLVGVKLTVQRFNGKVFESVEI
jgi:hypothetical protein